MVRSLKSYRNSEAVCALQDFAGSVHHSALHQSGIETCAARHPTQALLSLPWLNMQETIAKEGTLLYFAVERLPHRTCLLVLATALQRLWRVEPGLHLGHLLLRQQWYLCPRFGIRKPVLRPEACTRHDACPFAISRPWLRWRRRASPGAALPLCSVGIFAP